MIFHSYANFTLMMCKSCQLIYQEQVDKVQQEQLIKDIYDSNWVAMRDLYAVNTLREHAAFSVLLLDMFFRKKGKLLEIGSGTGEFLWLAREAGWQVQGLEPSAVACEYANDRYGLNLRNELWELNLFEADEKFDAIVFWHVLEHIPSPVSFMEQVSTVLAPGGRILFSVPNQHSLTNALQGASSPLFTEEDHLFHYAKRHIEHLMSLSHLEIISLFSREEPARLENDLRIHPGTIPSLSEKEKIKMMIGLQAGWNGHEIFCVAGRSI
ncbi:class I SAM-dependent methyltransferase [Paenibacillus planticolens]|uniref:Methyltransferase domain-containing protein n=1 Tax=Paenibacillus planticolens TaxID=2654976 RepID=A0ABX1ZFS8_9BACL|nr:class I SAM-dependent methyltransferase [Paenibacillus planticolens]NOU98946.1 methyltransferase domain-containing protein [Paenibacillus planticolens]